MARVSGILSVRTECDGGDIASETRIVPEFWLEGTPHLVLLVHGFNNDVDEARASFRDLTRLLPDRFPKIGWFYWPGDADLGWFDFLDFVSYPTEIVDARGSALLLADTLRRFGELNPLGEVTLVGHSLGCRLIAECLSVMNTRPPIRAVVFLAAAVPVELAESGEYLGNAIRSLAGEGYVFHSANDSVLQYAFPAGQAAAALLGYEKHVYLEPMGLHGNPADIFPQPAINRPGNGHGSYWKDTQVVQKLSDICGAAISRASESRSLPAPRAISSRGLPEWTGGSCKLT